MDKTELSTRFTDTMAKFTAYFGKHLPDDVLAKLKAHEARHAACQGDVRLHVYGPRTRRQV